MRRLLTCLALCSAASLPLLAPMPLRAAGLRVTRATLANGLRVVVVHDPLAPVVTTVMNYEVGSDEQTLPGLAHATEHMMFRGSRTLSSSQLMNIAGMTGGEFDADTQNAITQYYFTVPAQYLAVALRLERSRATGLLMSQSQWNQERLAITQEVTQDDSNGVARLLKKTEQRLLAGTPYAKNTLGTIEGFAHAINAPQLRQFYDAWYHPNNAVYVIAGDVDGPSTIALVRSIFGSVPAARLPRRPPVRLRPITAATYRETTALPVSLVLLCYRMPGYASPDFAAGQILGDVLASQRGALYALVAQGKMLFTSFAQVPYAQTSIGIDYGVIAQSASPQAAAEQMRAVIAGYRRTGVPTELVAAAKRREIAQLQYSRDSVQGLALDWSDALAAQGLHSPDDMLAEYEHVTVASVNRILREDIVDTRSVTAYAVPHNTGAVSMGSSAPAAENNVIPPSRHEPLPAWARRAFGRVLAPRETLAPKIFTLANGVRLIVQPEFSSSDVLVSGSIRNDPAVQEPSGEEGINDVTESLMPFGTTTYGRVAYQAQLDSIAANVSTGTSFSLQVLGPDFDRGVQLLADGELHPAFASPYFSIVKAQEVQAYEGELRSPEHLAAAALARALYPAGDPAQRFATPQSVGTLTLDDVRAWYASAYRPDLTTIVVVGDISPGRAYSEIERYFGSWRSEGPKPVTLPPAAPQNAPSGAVVPATGRIQSSVQLVETVQVSRTSPAWAALEVANEALTGGFYSSLLYHDLREVHGYAYSVQSSLEVAPTRGTFGIDYACDPKNILPAQRLAIGDLRRLEREPLSSERLMRAKALLMGSVPIEQSSYQGLAAEFLSYSLRGLPWNQSAIDAAAELRVTAAAVEDALRTYIRPDAFVRIVVGPGPV
ncbi:MAG: M16 family metallopeptidase [Candidatus Tyrphobacter sp.]